MRHLFVAIVFLSLLNVTTAQHFEVGAMVGTAQYMGDLSEPAVKIGHTRPAIGLFTRFQPNEYLGLAARFHQGRIFADDALSGNPSREARNLSFRSNISSFSLTPEVYFPGFDPFSKFLSPYAYAGVSLYHFNPQAELDGQWLDLQPLGTEGQGLPGNPFKYSLYRFAIVYGGGIRYCIHDNINIGIEFNVHQTGFDHLDDVSGAYVDDAELEAVNGANAVALANRTGKPTPVGSNRGNPESNDWYGFLMITVSYNIFPY